MGRAILDLVTLDLLVPFDRITGLAVDELAFYPIAGLPIESVEGDPFRRYSSSHLEARSPLPSGRATCAGVPLFAVIEQTGALSDEAIVHSQALFRVAVPMHREGADPPAGHLRRWSARFRTKARFRPRSPARLPSPAVQVPTGASRQGSRSRRRCRGVRDQAPTRLPSGSWCRDRCPPRTAGFAARFPAAPAASPTS